jgi:integrase
LQKPHDSDAVTWLAVLRASGRSPHTLTSYSASLRQFEEILAGRGAAHGACRNGGLADGGRPPGPLSPKEREILGCGGRTLASVTKADAIAAVETMRFRWTPGGVSLRLRVLRAFYNWLVAEEVIPRSPFKGISVKVPDEPQRTASDEDVARMLAGANKRDTAIITLLCDTGARKGEVAALEPRDVDLDSGSIHFRTSKSRPRFVPLSDRAVVALARWLRQRGTAPGSLWASSDPYALVGAVVKRRSNGTLTAHTLRRRFASNWLKQGLSETSLMRICGWSSLAMIATYSRAAADEISEAEYRRFVS